MTLAAFALALTLIAALMTACGNFTSDIGATLEAERSGIIAEATAIAGTRSANTAQTAATAAAAQAHVAHQQSINEALLATVRAVITPTAQQIANAGFSTPRAIADGRRWFVKTGMASSVRASDGCVENPAIQFTPSSPRIYATFMAYNIGAGTPLMARWSHEGEVVREDSFPTDRAAGEICLWFYIDPTITPFTPGTWSVQLYADAERFPLESPMTFRIVPDS